MNEEWKIEMLKKLWAGEDTDLDKLNNKAKSKDNSSSNQSSIPSIDLHKFHQLDKQLTETEKAIDQAILKGHSGLVIIHGKGQGILKSQIKKLLKVHKHVAEFKSLLDHGNESGSIMLRFK